MARFKEDAVQALLMSRLEPGEELKHWAYGVKQPHILLLIIFLPLAAALTKNYIVGLTNRRFIVLQVSNSLNVEQAFEDSGHFRSLSARRFRANFVAEVRCRDR